MLSIHIISTGTEITSGKSVDTNSTWIANELTGLGFSINKFLALPDKPLLIEEEIRSIMARPGENLIIMTGGLGATDDDHTLNVVCKIVEKDAVTDQKALDKLTYFSEQRGKMYQDLLPVSKRQTTIPLGARPLDNDIGLAPGFYLELNTTTRLAAMPGVPKEMKKMFSDYFLPLMKKDYNKEDLQSRSRSIWGVTESIFQATFIKKHQELINEGLEWGVTAKPGHIKVTFKSTSSERLRKIISFLDTEYKEKIGDEIFLDIHSMLISSKRTVSTAESCTGGLVGKILTDMSGSSAYYLGSVVAYHNDIKQNILGVKKSTLDTVGAVSSETAIEMAEGVQHKFNTNYAISVTGIAGPTGATKDKKVGLVYIGIKANHEETKVFRYEIPLSRDIFRDYVANIALFHLYQKLKQDNL
ncbi:MAG TPA: nicotinamide-nucleotide amidohydrolase family protein [Leptospiraceae bacterium]|nr:nicotinamide-nucleotide amidohydrolase family protein [Leptospiraceae bacterium]HMW07664.1 nicotinamide-nucleotide amidohydrolase family protein [Leptospiraceae bacterium]HMX33798.1 nicotinamide-nucleotide amidohydrolase family protein [Leptospiraceae bacterium]HMY33322.1 nicotinamide-nucleotide amidohydrolase family protein [Leptospiraceae bacterium]HMZ63059.1 nicotinamide-nucleotide amidohydrolase family protein [Leptospiraceae bacterium]